MSFVKRVWTSQPQVPVGIDWSNPIASKLSAAATPFANFKKYLPVESRAKRNGTGVVLAPGVGGVGFSGDGTSTNVFRLHSTANSTTTAWEEPVSAATWMAVFVRKGHTPSGNAPIFQNGSPDFYPYVAYGITDSGGLGILRFECSAGNSSNLISEAVELTNNRLYVAVGRYNGSVLEGFLNGSKLVNTQACSGNLVYPNTNNRGPAVGNFWSYTDSGRSFNGSVYLVSVWPSALSDTEIKSLSVNPWQIFAPLKQPIFVPLAWGVISDLIIDMTKANALATGIQAQILYDQLMQMLSAPATTPSKSFNIDKTLDLLKAAAQATGIQFNVDIAMLLAMAVANAQATGIKTNIDKAINIQLGTSIASGGNILLDKAINLAFANSNASGVKLNIDKTIDVVVANAQASGITTLLDIVKNLVVGNAAANSNGFGSGSVLNLNTMSGIATGTKAALDKVINQAVANATANAPKFNLDRSINTIVANALATGIITNLDKQILAKSANALATGITTILEYAVALAMNSGSASATGTTIRIDKQILIAAGIANATGVDVSVVFTPFTYEPAFIIFRSETDLVVLDVIRGDIIVAPEQILQSLVSESRTNVFDSMTRISTFNRE